METVRANMFITALDGPDDDSQAVTEFPDWQTVETAIRRLDAVNATLLVLSAGEEVPFLMVGGGNGLYVVCATWDNGTFFNLLDMTKPAGKKVLLVAGGQEGDYESRHCVTLDTALKAARSFAEHGTLHPDLSWSSE